MTEKKQRNPFVGGFTMRELEERWKGGFIPGTRPTGIPEKDTPSIQLYALSHCLDTLNDCDNVDAMEGACTVVIEAIKRIAGQMGQPAPPSPKFD